MHETKRYRPTHASKNANLFRKEQTMTVRESYSARQDQPCRNCIERTVPGISKGEDSPSICHQKHSDKQHEELCNQRQSAAQNIQSLRDLLQQGVTTFEHCGMQSKVHNPKQEHDDQIQNHI